jgi:RHS repeat-associated protein
MSRPRNLALIYNSSTAGQPEIVGANLAIPSSIALDSASATIRIDGDLADSTMFREGLTSGTTVRLALEVTEPPVSGDALVPYEVTVVAFAPTGATTLVRSSHYLQIDRSGADGEFGDGWWLSGYEHLTPVSDAVLGDGLLWSGGDGSARLYLPTSAAADTFVAQTRGRPDTILAAPPPVPDSAWYLSLQGNEGAYTPVGQHHHGLDGGSVMTWAFWFSGLQSYPGAIGGLMSATSNIWYSYAIGFSPQFWLRNPNLVQIDVGAVPYQLAFWVFQYDGAQTGNANRFRAWRNNVEQPLTFQRDSVPESLASDSLARVYLGKVFTLSLYGWFGEYAILRTNLTAKERLQWYEDGIDFGHAGLVAGYEWRQSLEDVSPLGNDLSSTTITVAGNDFARTLAYPSRVAPGGSWGSLAARAAYARHVTGGGTVYYDAAGRHIGTVDRNGNETRFNHQMMGTETRLTSIDLPTREGPKPAYEFAYDPTTHFLEQVRVVGADGGWLSYDVMTSAAGASYEIDEIEAPDGLTAEFVYASGLLKTMTDHRGAVTEVHYVHQKVDTVRVVTPEDASIPTITMTYRAASTVGVDTLGQFAPSHKDSAYAEFNGPRTDVTDVTRFYLTGWGAVRQIRDPLNHWTTLQRSDTLFPGFVTRVAYPNGRYVRAFYDSFTGLLESTEDHADSTATTEYEWDARWRKPTLIRTPGGIETNSTYDTATGNLTAKWVGSDTIRFHYDAYGQPDSIWSARNKLTTLAYDSLGNLESETTPLGIETTYERDAVGRPLEIRMPTEVEGSPGELVESYLYDQVGREVRHQSTNTLDAAAAWDSTAYNALKERIAVYRRGSESPEAVQRFYNDSTASLTPDSILMPLEWTYDQLGRTLTETTDQMYYKAFEYDVAGNLTRTLTRAGDTIWMEYDELNRLSRRRASNRSYATTTQIDGQVPLPGLWQFPFLASPGGGRDVQGDSATFTYDVMGNLTRAENRDAIIARTYGKMGELRFDSLAIRVHDADTIFVGGGDGPPIIRPAGTFRSFGTEYVYDLDGRVTELRYPGHASGSPKRATYAYESISGHLTSVTDMLDNATSMEYDGDGRPTLIEHPGSLFESLTYDDDGRLFRRSVGAFFADSLLFDPAGRIVKVFQDPGAANNLTVDNAYDGLGHLTETMTDVHSNLEIERFVMDGLGRPRLRWTAPHHSTPSDHDAIEVSIHDENGRLALQNAVEIMPGEVDPPLYPAGDYPRYQTLTYDVNGDVETVGSYKKHTETNGTVWDWTSTTGTHNYYDAESRLRYRQRQTKVRTGDPLVISSSPGAWEEYRYDALGRRVAVFTLSEGICSNDPGCYGAARYVVWSGGQIAYEKSMPADADTIEAQYGAVYYAHAGGVDQPISVVHEDINGSNRKAMFPYVNWRGLYTLATDTAGDACHVTGGDCEGIARPGDRQTAFRTIPINQPDWYWYGSLMADQQDVTGLLYRRNRYYDPASGQFTQEDPIGIAGGLNLYGYANGDPINFSDPFGLCPVCVLGAAWAAFEIGSAAYDAYNAVRTVFSDASVGEKVGTVALAAASFALPGGGYTGAMSFSRRQLQHAFKHAGDFGVVGNASNRTMAAFSDAIQAHVGAAGTQAIKGTYRGESVIHHVDAATGLNVIQRESGEFLSGWKLSEKQLEHVLTSGNLGGGR